MPRKKPAGKRRKTRVSRTQSRSWLIWVGVVLVVVVALGVLIALQADFGGGGRDFRVVAYQQEDVFGGDEVELSDVLRHGKPVVLNFWAGQCPPCRQEMPGFQRVYDELGDSYVMVGVDIGPFVGLGSHDDARRFLDEFQISYPTAYAANGTPVRDHNVRSMPTTVFLTPDGQVFKTRVGFLAEDRLRSDLQELLASSS